MNPNEPYDYTTSGFDSFLSRSIDDLSQVNLSSEGPRTTQMRFDSAQISGPLGNVLRTGSILIDGSIGQGRIDFHSGNDVTLRLGELDG